MTRRLLRYARPIGTNGPIHLVPGTRALYDEQLTHAALCGTPCTIETGQPPLAHLCNTCFTNARETEK